MTTLAVPFDDEWLLSTGLSRAEVESELRVILAAKLFELQRLTLVQAAAVAGLSVWQFMDALSRLKVSVINLSEDELLDELRQP